MRAGGQGTKHQQPVFRRNPDALVAMACAESLPPPFPEPLVTPLSIFAARRFRFEAIVRIRATPREALALIFAELPLEEYGWTFEKTKISKSREKGGFTVWLVEDAT